MIVALLALAAAMMIAGITAVVQGFPYVRLESGMAMVYGGAVVGSAGVLLLGVAAVVASLKRVERALRNGVPTLAGQPIPQRSKPDHEPLVDDFQLVEAPPLESPRVESPPVEQPRVEASLIERSRVEPFLSTSSPRETRSEPMEDPLFGLAVAPPAEVKEKPKPAVPPTATLPPVITAKPVPQSDALAALRSSRDPLQEPAPSSKAERTAVGRYSSEGNTYVMFDDGSIEAETPKGRYTFASLDELKAFVDGGGERNTRGAA